MAGTDIVHAEHRDLNPIEANARWIDLQKELIRNTAAQGTTDEEFALFFARSQRTGLDPLSRQIYAIKRWTGYGEERRQVMSIQVSIDGLRLIAERTGKYGGQRPRQWCGRDGLWSDVWIPRPDEPYPYAAKATIIRRDWDEPMEAVANWDSYVQTAGKGDEPNSMWRKFSALMLGKCAESLALRTAFPHDMSDLYTAEEMGQDENEPVPAKPVATVVERPAPKKPVPPTPRQRAEEPAPPPKKRTASVPAHIGLALDQAEAAQQAGNKDLATVWEYWSRLMEEADAEGISYTAPTAKMDFEALRVDYHALLELLKLHRAREE